jgi:hypothetical protein
MYFFFGLAGYRLTCPSCVCACVRVSRPSDNGGVLAKQCEVIKKRQGKDFRCIVYRNTVIALNQFRHVSQILDDPQYAGYFLKFKQGATQATKADSSPNCWGIADPRAQGCTVRVFRQNFTSEDATEFHAFAPHEASRCVINGIPLGWPLSYRFTHS